jgi:tRNA (guanosine-2'-O-)-methyltransferase
VLSARRRERIERVLRHRLLSVTVVLENLHDPHNAAAAIRTCEGVGLVHVHVVGTSEPFFCSRKVSLNAHKWLSVYLHRDIDDCLGLLGEAGYSCLAAVPPRIDASPAPAEMEVAVDGPVALLYGNEHMGLSRRALDLADGRFSYPMYGFCESLNISVSVAVTLSRVVERRRRALGRSGDLPPGLEERLRAAYYAQSTPHTAALVLRSLDE